jgi:two-component system, chemotaxis family, chemotaxis protein CheY
MKKVLIVDDSEVIRQQLRRALTAAGLAVVEAADGADGLERVAEHSDLSLLVLDINMPRMNGLDMLDALRKDPKNAALPVLVLTTEAQHSMVARAKHAGAKAWMIKPVKMDQFIGIVQRFTT